MALPWVRLELLALVVYFAGAADCAGGPEFRPSQTALFSLGNAVNGGFVGSLGPALAALGLSTGMHESELGRAILQHRLAKMVATLALPLYAERLQSGRAPLSPHRLLFVCMALSAVCALSIIIGRSSSLVLQLALALAGFCYGTSDSLMTLVTLWQPVDATQRRTDVAWLNSGFTAGALMTPMAASVALRHGVSAIAAFVAVAALATSSALSLALCLSASAASPGSAASRVSPERAQKERAQKEREKESAQKKRADEGGEEKASSAEVGASEGVGGRRRLSLLPKAKARVRDLILVGCMSIVLFSATGCEHAVATWLPSFGLAVSGLELTSTSLLSSVYWTVNGIGRLLWAIFSPSIDSGWTVLFADASLMLVAASVLCLHHGSAAPRAWQLWLGALLTALGCASALPCAITMPSEMGVQLDARHVLLLLNVAGTAGEMFSPYAMGLAFEREWYGAFGKLVLVEQLAATAATALAYLASSTPYTRRAARGSSRGSSRGRSRGAALSPRKALLAHLACDQAANEELTPLNSSARLVEHA